MFCSSGLLEEIDTFIYLYIHARYIHVTLSSFAKVQSCFFLLVSVKALKRNLNPSCFMFDVLPFYSEACITFIQKLVSFEPCFGFATVICLKVETVLFLLRDLNIVVAYSYFYYPTHSSHLITVDARHSIYSLKNKKIEKLCRQT